MRLGSMFHSAARGSGPARMATDGILAAHVVDGVGGTRFAAEAIFEGESDDTEIGEEYGRLAALGVEDRFAMSAAGTTMIAAPVALSLGGRKTVRDGLLMLRTQ